MSNSESIAVAAVTFDRHDDLRILLKALSAQTANIQSVHLVDSGTQDATVIAEHHAPLVHYLRSERNLGGAGGFSYAMLAALASGAQWIWVMDDDAIPESPDVAEQLLAAAQQRGLDVVVPIIVNPEDHKELSFGFRLDGRLSHSRKRVEQEGFIPDVAQFFNGALIRAEVLYSVGLPDLRLFIRGDETEFMLKLRQAGIRFGTVTSVALSHPSGQAEVQHVFGDRLHVLVPETDFKKFYFFRNRGYLTRKYRRLRSAVADLVGYPIYYLRRRDFKGFSQWARAYWSGLRSRKFGPPDEFGF